MGSLDQEASAALWQVHNDKPSTHVLTPPKLGALREVARDNMFLMAAYVLNNLVTDMYASAEKHRDLWEKHSRQKRSKDSITSHGGRHKRSVSIERNVETLVVVDHWMMEFYKNEDIETYVLTIMNMVSVKVSKRNSKSFPQLI